MGRRLRQFKRSAPGRDIVSNENAVGGGASWWRAAGCWGWVRDRLMYFRWSRAQISAGLKLMHPDDPTCQVSHETNNGGDPRGGRDRRWLRPCDSISRAEGCGKRRRLTAPSHRNHCALFITPKKSRASPRLTETCARGLAQKHDLRQRDREGLSPGAGASSENRHLVLRPTCALATRLKREYQRIGAPVSAQGHRPQPGQPDLSWATWRG